MKTYLVLHVISNLFLDTRWNWVATTLNPHYEGNIYLFAHQWRTKSYARGANLQGGGTVVRKARPFQIQFDRGVYVSLPLTHVWQFFLST